MSRKKGTTPTFLPEAITRTHYISEGGGAKGGRVGRGDEAQMIPFEWSKASRVSTNDCSCTSVLTERPCDGLSVASKDKEEGVFFISPTLRVVGGVSYTAAIRCLE